jgi:hypothetical protein
LNKILKGLIEFGYRAIAIRDPLGLARAAGHPTS